MKAVYKHLSNRLKIYRALLAMALTLPASCMEERTTIVFGKVVDQDHGPVDSVMILAAGYCYLHAERIQHTFTNKKGEYIMKIDVPDEYYALNAFIPDLSENPKYETYYKTVKTFRNGRRTDACCASEIGEKTRWDFELGPK